MGCSLTSKIRLKPPIDLDPPPLPIFLLLMLKRAGTILDLVCRIVG